MTRIIKEILLGKDPLVSGAIALCVVLSIALGCNCNKSVDLANLANSVDKSRSDDTSTEGPPSNAVVEGLVKDTMKEFRDAVQSEDFSRLYNDASEDFQGTYTLDQVKSAFKSYTEKKKFVVPILDKVPTMDVEWDHPVGVRSEKGLNILMAAGKFKTKPYNVRFDYEYVKRGGEWKLLKLVINIP